MERLNISTVHLNSLGMVHEFRLIAAIYSMGCSVYEMKNPHKTGGNG